MLVWLPAAVLLAAVLEPPAPGSRQPRLVQLDRPDGGPAAATELRGRILLEDPAPNDSLAGLDLRVEVEPLGAGGAAHGGATPVELDAAGRFRCPDLPAGRYLVRALPASGAPFLPAAATVDYDPDSKTGVELLLPRPRFLVGLVEAPDHEPLGGLFVTVEENGLERGTAPSDDHGRFRIPAVGRGPYAFSVRDHKGRPRACRTERLAETRAPSPMSPGRVEATLVVP